MSDSDLEATRARFERAGKAYRRRESGYDKKRTLHYRAVACITRLAQETLLSFECLHPKDKRPRRAIEAALAWLNQPVTFYALDMMGTGQEAGKAAYAYHTRDEVDYSDRLKPHNRACYAALIASMAEEAMKRKAPREAVLIAITASELASCLIGRRQALKIMQEGGVF